MKHARKDLPLNGRVKYSRSFLKRIQVSATDPIWFYRGTIVAIKIYSGDTPTVYKVIWDAEPEAGPKGCLGDAIVGVGKLENDL